MFHRLETTNAKLRRAQDKAHLQANIETSDSRIGNTDAKSKLVQRSYVLRMGNLNAHFEEWRWWRGIFRLRTASLENLLKNAEDKTLTLSTVSKDRRELLNKEEFKTASLATMADCLGKEQLRFSREKDISDRERKELDETLSLV